MDGENELKADFFDDAETNQDIMIHPDIIGFEDHLENIGTDLDELRKNRNKPLIADELVSSAINIYIENALEYVKDNNMFDLTNSSSVSNHDISFKPAGEERRLMQKHIKGQDSPQMQSDSGYYAGKEERQEGLAELAENGNLFNIDLDSVYKSVGKRQVENFAKIYGTRSSA
jgi:hypothetical protein